MTTRRKRNVGGRPRNGRTEVWLVKVREGTKAAMEQLAIKRSGRIQKQLTTQDALDSVLHESAEFVRCFNAVNKITGE